MAAFSAARSIFRSCSVRSAASMSGSQAKTKATLSPFGVSANKPLSLGTLRLAEPCPNELLRGIDAAVSYCHCFGFDDIMALHFSRSYGWLPEATFT